MSMVEKRVKVQAGDSLASLAYKAYGDGSRFRDIADANSLDIFAADRMQPGSTLIIPSSLIKDGADAFGSTAQSGSDLDLSRVKQPKTANSFQLFSWVL